MLKMPNKLLLCPAFLPLNYPPVPETKLYFNSSDKKQDLTEMCNAPLVIHTGGCLAALFQEY